MNAEEFLAKWEDNDAAQLVLDEWVVDLYMSMASNVNNGGMREQLETLVMFGMAVNEVDTFIRRG